MWRNIRCLHMTDVEKSEIIHKWHVCDVENVAIYAICHMEKNLAQKYICGEKMTNIRSDDELQQFVFQLHPNKQNAF